MRRYVNRLAVLLTTLVMVLAFTLCVNAETTSDLKADYTGKTIVLSTNDVHGAIDGYEYAAGLKKELESRGAEVILIDCGDFSQGTTYVSESKGGSAVQLMNLAGYSFAALGNHEFDFGPDALAKNTSDANFKILCTNFVNKESGDLIYDAKALVSSTDSDLKIGFVGVATPETLTKALPTNFTVNTLLKEQAFAVTQTYVTDLKKEGADVIIAITHLGVDGESEPYRSIDLYNDNQAKEDKIDIILDGHSHTVMTEGANGEPIMSTGTKFNNIGVTVIDEATEKIETNFLLQLKEDGAYVDELFGDEAVAAKAAEITADVDAAYGTKIAESKVELNGSNSANGNFTNGNRDGETNHGDLITDAMIWYVKNAGTVLDVDYDNVVAITNGGGIRAAIKIGDVTKSDVRTVLPFGNTIAAVTVKGSELLEALEASTFSLPGTVGGFPQVAGIKFTVNIGKEYIPRDESYPSSTYYGPKTINRVKINEINGKAFDPNATYVVLTNNFCAVGGDTYYVFTQASNQFDTGITLDYAVAEYIIDALGGVIDETYENPQGRITIINDPNAKDDEDGNGSDDKKDEKPAEAKGPAAPKIKTAESYVKRQMTIAWNKVKGAASYKVAYRRVGDKKWTVKNTKKTTYVVKKLKKSGLYEFKVAAVAKQNGKTVVGEYSKTKTRYVEAKTPRLKAGKKSIKVRWTPDKKASGYLIKYATKKDMSDALTIVVKGGTKKAYTIKNLQKGKKYYVRLIPYKEKGEVRYTGQGRTRTVKAK